jgi:predicted nucleic acid-binding protein
VKAQVIADAGPIVALVNPKDTWHTWVKGQLGTMIPPLLTCEAVLTEACHILRKTTTGSAAVVGLVDRGLIAVPFRLEGETRFIEKLMNKYAEIPMSLADACLVRMSEQFGDCVILTLDSHFRIYRRHGREVIPALMPEGVQRGPAAPLRRLNRKKKNSRT